MPVSLIAPVSRTSVSLLAVAALTFMWSDSALANAVAEGDKGYIQEMGHINEQLHSEADAAAASLARSVQPLMVDPEIHQKLDVIQSQLTTIKATLETGTLAPAATASVQTTSESPPDAPAEAAAWRDEVSYAMVQGQSIEVNLVMNESATAEFE